MVELVDGDEMVYRAVSEGYARHLGLRLPRAGSLSGLCVEQAAILVCEDSETDPRVDRDACRRVGLRSMVCAPLFDGELAVGVLKAMAGEDAAFDIEEIELLRHMSQTLGAAIATRVDVSDLRRLLQERTAALERVERRNQRLAIVDDILDLSRVEAGKLTLEDGVVAPARLVESCAAMARPDARPRPRAWAWRSASGWSS